MDDCLVLLGDIVTPEDIPQLKAEGIAEFFLRGTSTEDIVNKNQLSAILASEEIQAIIFTSTDDVFASGANIRELTQLNPESARDFFKLGQGLFQKIAEASQATIAATNGYCMGGGLALALACDIPVAARSKLLGRS